MRYTLIPEPVLQRLPWYLSYVTSLRGRGVQTVSSTNISRQLNVESSQIAKDLSYLGLRGKTRIGYDVTLLERRLQDMLGFEESHAAVIVGAGSLGCALLQDTGLRRFGLNVVGAFDVCDTVVGRTFSGIEVSHLSTLPDLCRRLDVEIGVITVPAGVAQETADTLVSAGVRALWNFTPTRISVDPPTIIINTSLYAHLAVMYNKLNMLNQTVTDNEGD